jgi:hypothetical protein
MGGRGLELDAESTHAHTVEGWNSTKLALLKD